jgi:hypothetical protein
MSVERDFVFASAADRPHALRRAWSTVASRAPCSGGQEVKGLVVDDGQVGVLPVGAHELRALFEARRYDFELNTVLDVEIDDGECVRVPVVSQSIPLVGRRSPLLVASSAADFYGPLSGLSDVVPFRVGAGGWFGPALLTGQLGVAVAECKKELCGENDSGRPKYRTTLTGVADALVQVASRRGGGSFVNAVLGARYSYTPVTLPAPGETRHFGVHALQAVVGAGTGFIGDGPFQHVERGPLVQVNVPVGVAYAPGAPDERTAFVVGIEARLVMPVTF